jgi:hypothetical protein
VTLATLQHLRSFSAGDHPINLEPGQIAFNVGTGNIDSSKNDYNTYMYVGNGSNTRNDEGGTVLVSNGDVGKGWIRYRLRNVSVHGDTVYGDLTVQGAKLKVEASQTTAGELVVPRKNVGDGPGTDIGSVRWNGDRAILQSWDGNKWDSTSKVSVSTSAPSNPSEGDLWLDPAGAEPYLRVYVKSANGDSWVLATNSASLTALQPGNGVSANAQNQIELIDTGSF